MLLSNIWMACFKPQNLGSLGKKLNSVFSKTCSLLTGFCHQIHLRHAGWNNVENMSLLQSISQPICAHTQGIPPKQDVAFLMCIWSGKLFTCGCLWPPHRALDILKTTLRKYWADSTPASTFCTWDLQQFQQLVLIPRTARSVSSTMAGLSVTWVVSGSDWGRWLPGLVSCPSSLALKFYGGRLGRFILSPC